MFPLEIIRVKKNLERAEKKLQCKCLISLMIIVNILKTFLLLRVYLLYI